MEAVTLKELQHNFHSSLGTISQAVLLSSITDDKSYRQLTFDLQQTLHSCRAHLGALSLEMQKAKEQLQHLKMLQAQSDHLVQLVQFALAHIPARLPSRSAMDRRCDTIKGQSDLKGQVQSSSLSQSSTTEVNDRVSRCNFLDFLTVEEFEAIPKYMKGRLSYERVNAVIEELDKAYTCKYRLLAQKKSSLSDYRRKLCDRFKQEESRETEGIHFIVEKDISEFSSLKVDATIRKILTILRHCSLIHEIRGGGHVRLALC